LPEELSNVPEVSSFYAKYLNLQKRKIMFDMMKMMGKMKEVQAKIKEAQENLVHIKVTGESGGGMVRVPLMERSNWLKLKSKMISSTKMIKS
jgi:hypothetical protein